MSIFIVIFIIILLYNNIDSGILSLILKGLIFIGPISIFIVYIGYNLNKIV